MRAEVARSLVGTESTCVTVLEATLELIPKPTCVSLLVVGYPDKFRNYAALQVAADDAAAKKADDENAS